MKIFGKTFKGDKVIWCIFFALCVISLLEVFSATSTLAYRMQSHWAPIIRHTIYLLGGFALIMILQMIKPRYFSMFVIVLPLSLLLLIFTLIFGSNVNDAQRWINLGTITIQPSEIAKIATICFVAFCMSRMKPSNENFIFKLLIGTIAFTCALIAPENLSTACLLFLVCFLMMFIGQIKFKWLAMIAGSIAIVGIIFIGSITVLPESTVEKYLPDRFSTWKARIERHSSDEDLVNADGTTEYKITDGNYQVSHAKIAIANGGIIGLPGSGIERDFLPQAYSDFIFAIILEEMGLAGGLFVILLYVALLIRAGVLASKCEKKFPRYLILGAALMLTIQALVNMAVAVNLIPVTGQPLPLISRGGTSTIITCAYFGIILACSSKANLKEHNSTEDSIAETGQEKSTEIEDNEISKG